MLKEIIFNNFKCFQDETLDLQQLTILTGLNGVGKSTLIQALLLIMQSSETEAECIKFNGYWIELGTKKDVHSFFAEEDTTRIILKDESGTKWEIRFSLDMDDDSYIGNKRLENLTYISADRWGPRLSLPISREENIPSHVGRYGEYVSHCLAISGDTKIVNDDLATHSLDQSRTLYSQVNAWMSEISPGVKIVAHVIEEIELGYASFAFETDKDMSPQFKPVHVGFGLSYTLPIVVALLSAKRGDIIAIENPEAHLHPAGQTTLGKLISKVAHTGVQVIVESHSDHFLDGVRISVKDRDILNTAVRIYYFDKGSMGETKIQSPAIDETGKINQWPSGFFDQSILNLANLNTPK